MKCKLFFVMLVATFAFATTGTCAQALSFSDVRALIPAAAGELTLDAGTLEGIVVSDADNPNMETNPQTAANNYDFAENDRTAYIQAADGSYGFRLKFTAAEDNTLVRYATVTVSLTGLTLIREDDPVRYTLTGLTAAHIAATTPGTASAIASKSKLIKDLTDDDLYTFVQLPQTEISLPYGSYINVNAGYFLKTAWNSAGATTPYVDAAPTAIRDNAGGHASLLTNSKAPWCRHTLPIGRGTLSGIVVHSKIKRFGGGDGYIGRYSVRVLNEDDINFTQEPARVLAEWNWLAGKGDPGAGTPVIKASGTSYPAAFGSGTMTRSTTGSGPSLGAHPVYHEDVDSKVLANSAITFGSDKWWDWSSGKGNGFIFRFSTAGISGSNLTINFSQGSGSGTAATLNTPTYWQLEVSTDGVDYAILPNSVYAQRPLGVWGGSHLFTCPGLQNHSFSLPDSLFDKTDVYVRLAAQSNICAIDAADGGDGGIISSEGNNASVNVRLGVVSFRYDAPDDSQASYVDVGFADLKAAIPGASGSIQISNPSSVVTAIVAGAGSANLETNPNTVFNNIDYTVTDSAIYVQSVDGTSGIRIKAGNVYLPLYSRVKIAANTPLTLVKEADPERYTLYGLMPENIISITPGTVSDVAGKVKSIDQLTDADLYTYVRIPEVEMALPYGTYTNENWGYSIKNTVTNPNGATTPYVDAVPSTIRDKSGQMYMLTNVLAPWANDLVSGGSGSIGGIIVHSRIKRYAAGDGYIGRYAIRPVKRADISLNSPSYTQTLAEWHWMTNGACAAGTITKEGNMLPPVTGLGTLTCTQPDWIASAGVGPHAVCNNTSGDSYKQPNTAMQISNKWWNTATGTGEGFIAEVSTAGIAGSNLTLNFSQGSGTGSATTLFAPVYWQVAVSTDGDSFTPLDNGDYSVRPTTAWNGNHNFTWPGLQEHSIALPDSLFGKEKVYVRLAAKSDVCGINAADGGEAGTITSSENSGNIQVRLGVVSFKYVQDAETSISLPGAPEQTDDVFFNASRLAVRSSGLIRKISVIDLSGKTVFSGEYAQNSVEIAAPWPSGVYIVKVASASGVNVAKVLKQ
ncbi:MAG: T9SS type A sorting domain-containing protein [Tannerella sp.]|jgi:hypothetical protein|nr:T9SS type A sorting domain-containing protein [Tannerella sp.]